MRSANARTLRLTCNRAKPTSRRALEPARGASPAWKRHQRGGDAAGTRAYAQPVQEHFLQHLRTRAPWKGSMHPTRTAVTAAAAHERTSLTSELWKGFGDDATTKLPATGGHRAKPQTWPQCAPPLTLTLAAAQRAHMAM